MDLTMLVVAAETKRLVMTRYAAPEVIACPYCEQRFLRHVLRSFNSCCQVTYSDGSATGALENVIITESRCTRCQKVTEHVEDLPALRIKSMEPFWRKWFVKQQYLYLPHASIDVYFELFDKTDVVQEKRNWAVKAYRSYNQNFLVYGQERAASDEMKQRYRDMTDFILGHPPTSTVEEYKLICADIFRLRGNFLRSNQMYDTVLAEKFDYIVEQGNRWCDANNASLMAIQKQSQLREAKEAV